MRDGPAPAAGIFDDRERRLVAVNLGLGAILLIVALVFAVRTLESTAADTRAVAHTLEAETAIREMATLSEQIETARRGYLIQQKPVFAQTMLSASDRFDLAANRLERLVSDNPQQVERVRRVKALRAEKKELLAQLLADPTLPARVRVGDFDSDRGVAITREKRRLFEAMNATEKALLARRNQNQYDSLVAFYFTGGLAIAMILALMVGAIVLMLRYNRALELAQRVLQTANEGLEQAVEARTAELSRANAEIQRFAYIVSHDLRSPLVNVLGFTAELDEARKQLHAFLTALFTERPELRDEATWLAVDEDLPEALGFIRTSTEKMDRLINSILELSRQGRRTLRPEVLDMTELAEGVAATMKQRADAAGATVAVGAMPALTSDRMAVEQILANLTENALKYLKAGRAGDVRLSGHKTGRWVHIEVADNGRGIAPADHERIFELFRRAGAQDQAGEGIGLANVRALAYRLGGRVEVASELDEGSRFTLILPEKLTVTEPSA